ncbi:MAG: hypothetical protein K2X93_00430 [Candidatus Obscuribacterales bacterium]|nr:hypothetical protein [Candidatus Obscuribacterales bacterium]
MSLEKMMIATKTRQIMQPMTWLPKFCHRLVYRSLGSVKQYSKFGAILREATIYVRQSHARNLSATKDATASQ